MSSVFCSHAPRRTYSHGSHQLVDPLGSQLVHNPVFSHFLSVAKLDFKDIMGYEILIFVAYAVPVTAAFLQFP